MNTEIEKIFRPIDDVFTIYVVEQRFATRRGYEYLHSFLNTSNLITTDAQIKKNFSKIVENIEKKVTPVSSLLSMFTSKIPIVSIADAVTALCKLFTVHEHQAVGPNVVDPIILQEGKITPKMLTKLININKDSILSPTIIIILKDNDFERAKMLMAECPDGINIKMIRDSGEETIYKVVNCGANNIAQFIDSFSSHCYSTCSKTKRDILLDADWANNRVVSKYAPMLFQIRTDLLFDNKDEIRADLEQTIRNLQLEATTLEQDNQLIKGTLCMAKLFSVFCNDGGQDDMMCAYKLATELDNEILLGHVYRYAEFIPNCSITEKNELYDRGYSIFKNNRMMDHAIYCKNNKLIEQFYSDKINPEAFRAMQEEAVNSVPGMVGLSHIYNNVGAAYLYCGDANSAIDFFKRGLDYAQHHDRVVQRLALLSNEILAKCYSFTTIDDNEFYFVFRQIFDGMGTSRLPFLSADYVLNILSVAYRQKKSLGESLVNEFQVKKLIDNSFSTNKMGSGERVLQLQYLAAHYGQSFPLLQQCKIPPKSLLTVPCGKKKDFILRYGFAPFEFNTWL